MEKPLRTNDELFVKLKARVMQDAGKPGFRHHKWFVTYHLEIVEKIARELCVIYSQADLAKVSLLVWLHDYEKIVDFSNQYNTRLAATEQLMQEIGYTPEAVQEMRSLILAYNAKEHLAAASLEVQIVSSADAASHLVGPFITLWWYENPTDTIESLQEENRRKLQVDWEQKITLPEVREVFQDRYRTALEITGQLPESYLL